MKRVLRLFAAALFTLTFLIQTIPASHASEGDVSPETPLHFQPDGTFTVMLISDAQDVQYTSSFYTQAIRETVSQYPVDLVVFLGNQLEAGSPVLRIGDQRRNIRSAIENLTRPVADASIPFAVILGNQDYAAALPAEDQRRYYQMQKGYLLFDEPGGTDHGVGSVPIYSSDNSRIVMNFYLFDSGNLLDTGEYGAASTEQINWYREKSQALRTENNNLPVPSVALSHTAPVEIYELFRETPITSPGALAGTGAGAGKWFLPDTSHIFAGDVVRAPASSADNNGLFDAFIKNGDVFLHVSGNDRENSFIGSLHGIDLAVAPGCSYTGYDNGDARGVRLFRFTEYNVKDYETLHVRFSENGYHAGLSGVWYYLTTSTGIPNYIKCGVCILLLLICIVVLIALLIRKGRTNIDAETLDDAEEEPENPYL